MPVPNTDGSGHFFVMVFAVCFLLRRKIILLLNPDTRIYPLPCFCTVTYLSLPSVVCTAKLHQQASNKILHRDKFLSPANLYRETHSPHKAYTMMAKTTPWFAPYGLSKPVMKTIDSADGLRSAHQQKQPLTAGPLGTSGVPEMKIFSKIYHLNDELRFKFNLLYIRI
jgi:hypothetical protein